MCIAILFRFVRCCFFLKKNFFDCQLIFLFRISRSDAQVSLQSRCVRRCARRARRRQRRVALFDRFRVKVGRAAVWTAVAGQERDDDDMSWNSFIFCCCRHYREKRLCLI